jgi:hypothetical protein
MIYNSLLSEKKFLKKLNTTLLPLIFLCVGGGVQMEDENNPTISMLNFLHLRFSSAKEKKKVKLSL